MKYTLNFLGVLGAVLVAASVQAAPAPDAGMRMLGVENYQGAEAYFQSELQKNPQDAQAAAGLAKVNLAQGRNKAGVEWAEKAVVLAPQDASYQALLGEAYGIYVNDVSFFSKLSVAHKCLAAFQQAVNLDPTDADARSDLAGYYIQAPGIAGGSLDKAREQIMALSKIDPVQGDEVQAILAMQNKDEKAAESYTRDAAKLDKTGDGDYQLGLLLLGQNRFAEAISVFKDGIRKNPGNSENYYQVGHAAVLGKISIHEGIADLQKYLTLPHDWHPSTPTYKWAHYRLGMLYALAGDKMNETAQYRAALNLDPDFKEAEAALAALK